MAKTKNSTKCTTPSHKPRVVRKQRVAKASLVSKKNTSGGGRTFRRGEDNKDIEFNDLTHKIRNDVYEGFKGKLLSKDSEGNVTFRLLINPRGKSMKENKIIILHQNFLEDVNSADMLSLLDVDGEEEEDKALVEYEKKTWECSKCKSNNTNEGSYCTNVFGGKVCGAPKPFDGKILGWGDCFKVSAIMIRCCSCSFYFQAHVFSLLFAQQNEVETWTCVICSIKNSTSVDKCIACEAPNKESSFAVLSSIGEEATADDNIASLSAGVKNYTISGKGKRRKLEEEDSP